MSDLNIPASVRDALAAVNERAERYGVARFVRRVHQWASPAWRDLPALLRSLRDGTLVLAMWATVVNNELLIDGPVRV